MKAATQGNLDQKKNTSTYMYVANIIVDIMNVPYQMLKRIWQLIFYTQAHIWKIIYLNCGERYGDMIDHRSYAHNLSSSEIKGWKKFRPEWVYFEPTKWPAPRWLDSSVGRTLHRYCRGHGFESRSFLTRKILVCEIILYASFQIVVMSLQHGF